MSDRGGEGQSVERAVAARRLATRVALGAAVALFALWHLERGRPTNYVF